MRVFHRGHVKLGIGLLVLGLALVPLALVAQQFVTYYASRIYFGSTSGPAIRWGSSDPTGACVAGSLYLQKKNGLDDGNVWKCVKDPAGTSTGIWQSVSTGGNGEYLITDFGAVCDGARDNGAVLNAITALIAARADKTGTIVLPPTEGSHYCAYAGTWRLGPSTVPLLVDPGSAPGINPISITITPPRSATLSFAASSTTIDFTGTTLTSSDVGNEVWYGTADAAYTAFDARSVVPTPAYTCVIASVNAGAHTAVCTPPSTANQGTIASAGPTNTPVTMSTATTGSRTAYISNDHDFVVVDSNDLIADHIGKSVQLVMPALRAPLNLLNQTRNGVAQVDTGTQPCSNNGSSGQPAAVGNNRGTWAGGTTYATNDRVQHGGYQWISRTNSNVGNTPPTYPTLSTASWYFQDSFQCQNGGNLKLKQYAAHITAVSDTKHGKLSIDALVTGNSNWVGAFNEAGHTTETNSGAYNAHEWCHALAASVCYFSSSAHFNHTIDYDAFTTPYKVSSSADAVALSASVQIFPYFQPLDTSTVHISVRGAGAYSTTMRWLGPGSEPSGGEAYVAMMIARNKEFTLDGFTLYNGETCGGGSCYDEHGRVGMLFGGLPTGGTQTFGFIASQLQVSGFHQCLLLGATTGGEMSDSQFNELSVTYCDYGVRTGPGAYNTLDLKFHKFNGGFNKVAMQTNTGNVEVDSGSFSYNAIDFYGHGFGHFTVEGMRSEGPGRFFYGSEPGLVLRNNTISEPQGSRVTTGTVTCTPSDVRTLTVDVGADTGGPPTNTFYPLAFSADALTPEDIGKTLVIELTGGNLIGYVNHRATSTTGELVRQFGTAAVESGKTAYVYDTDKCALVFGSHQIEANDVGGAFMLPSGDTHNSYADLVKVYVDSVDSATTGTGHWLLVQGGPVVHAGSSDVNPVFFDNIVIELTAGYTTIIDNLLSTSLISLQPGTGQLELTNSQIAAFPILNSDALPARMEACCKAWHITTTDPSAFPAPGNNTAHSTGIQFPGAIVDSTNSYQDGAFRLQAANNVGLLFTGPQWPLQDLVGIWRNGFEAFTKRPVSPSTGSGHTYYDNHPTDPPQPQAPIGWVTSISSAALSNSRNLVVAGTFATSDTLTFAFKRDETIDFVWAAGSNYNPAERVAKFLVTSGHFSGDDVGRTVCFDNPGSGAGTRNVCGYITEIVDATHIKVKQAIGSLGIIHGTTDTTYTAHIGDDEPNTNYRITGYSCDAPEALGFTALTTSGFTVRSSNATSTATCRFFIVHY
jgi:hypothetical protein